MTFMRRHDEALELIDQATALLRSFGDERRILRSEVVKGNVHQFRGEFEVARAKYERLLTAPELSDDLHTLGVLYNNLAAACAILGRNSEAVTALEHARAIFTDLDMPAEVDRTGWVLANVLLKTGEFPKAVVLLGRLRDSFLARQLPEDAGLVGLDLVEGLIAMERVEEARALTEQVVNEFRRAQLNAQAIRALAYLRDLLPRSQQPRRAVRHVRSYLEKLQSEPELLFLPLED
jgi:tetratricopeptide (TPR) repeat protein